MDSEDDVSLPPDDVSLPPGSDISLPSDVESDAEQAQPVAHDASVGADFSDGSVVSVKKEDDRLDCSRNCCKHRCWEKINSGENAELYVQWLDHRAYIKDEEVSEVVFRMLQKGHELGKKQVFLGQHVCKTAFLRICKIGNSKFVKLRKAVKQGLQQPPRDMRHSRVVDTTDQNGICQRWLQLKWEQVAEFMAEEQHPLVTITKFDGTPYVTTFDEWVVGPGSTVEITQAASGQVKRLPAESFVDFWHKFKEHCIYVDEMPEHIVPSFSTLLRAYQLHYKDCLKFRKDGDHAKCSICEKFKAYRRLASSPEDHAKVACE